MKSESAIITTTTTSDSLGLNFFHRLNLVCLTEPLSLPLLLGMQFMHSGVVYSAYNTVYMLKMSVHFFSICAYSASAPNNNPRNPSLPYCLPSPSFLSLFHNLLECLAEVGIVVVSVSLIPSPPLTRGLKTKIKIRTGSKIRKSSHLPLTTLTTLTSSHPYTLTPSHPHAHPPSHPHTHAHAHTNPHPHLHTHPHPLTFTLTLTSPCFTLTALTPSSQLTRFRCRLVGFLVQLGLLVGLVGWLYWLVDAAAATGVSL